MDGEPLVEGGAPTSYCLDLVAESGVDAEAEVVQGRVGAARDRFRVRADGEREYRDFRSFLVMHATASQEEAERALLISGLSVGELYEPLPVGCLSGSGEGQVFHPCPRCGWPMVNRDGRVECQSSECRSEGARFEFHLGRLRPLGASAVPAPRPAAGMLRLRRGAWRYTVLPGLAELALERQLKALPGTVVQLWPRHDRFDLVVEHGGRCWFVDVKDWSSPAALARHLDDRERDVTLDVVVPDARERHVRILRDQCPDPSLRFHSLSSFVEVVRNAIAG